MCTHYSAHVCIYIAHVCQSALSILSRMTCVEYLAAVVPASLLFTTSGCPRTVLSSISI